MKMIKIKVLIVFFLNLGFVYSQCNNEKARLNFNKDLSDVLKSTKDSSDSYAMSTVVHRLSKITNISSESPGNFIGQFEPTKRDHRRWKKWFKKNGECLCWDEEKEQYYLREEEEEEK